MFIVLQIFSTCGKNGYEQLTVHGMGDSDHYSVQICAKLSPLNQLP